MQDLSAAIAAITLQCDRLGITTQQALERFGTEKAFDRLTPLELVSLQDAMARW